MKKSAVARSFQFGRIDFTKSQVRYLFLLFPLALYLFCLPSTIQTNDTAEMVGNAQLLKVIHPPGYPLFTWIYFFFQHTFTFGTIFFRGALLTTFLSIGCLAFLLRIFRNVATPTAFAALAVLATSRAFWEYSVLPDKFALNLFLVAGFLSFYLEKDKKLRERRFVPMAVFFGLGLAHHYTILFLGPLWLHAWLKAKTKVRMVGMVWTVALPLVLYGSLFLLDSHDPMSWRNLDGFKDLFAMLVRSDYGLLNLAGNTGAPEVYTHLSLFIRYLWDQLGIMLFFFPFSALVLFWPRAAKVELRAELRLLLFCFLAYLLIFFSMANVRPTSAGLTIIERFYLLASLLIVVIFGLVEEFLEKPMKQRGVYFTALLLFLGAVQNVFSNFEKLNYRTNTVVEDYLTNFLNEVALKRPAVILSEYDTHYFGLRYLQRVERPAAVQGQWTGEYTDTRDRRLQDGIYISTLSSLFEKRNLDFLKAAIPSIQIFDDESALVQANLGRIRFFVAEPRQIGRFKPVYGRSSMELVAANRSGSISDAPVLKESELLDRTSRELIEHGRDYHMTLVSYALYCQWYFYRAQEELQKNSSGVAEVLLKQGIAKVPFCWPAREQLCQIEMVSNPGGFESCMVSARYQKESRYNYYW